jgi:hypothetical protein
VAKKKKKAKKKKRVVKKRVVKKKKKKAKKKKLKKRISKKERLRRLRIVRALKKYHRERKEHAEFLRRSKAAKLGHKRKKAKAKKGKAKAGRPGKSKFEQIKKSLQDLANEFESSYRPTVFINSDGSIDGELKISIEDDDADQMLFDVEEGFKPPPGTWVSISLRYAPIEPKTGFKKQEYNRIGLMPSIHANYQRKSQKAENFLYIREVVKTMEDRYEEVPVMIVVRVNWNPKDKHPLIPSRGSNRWSDL